MLDLPPEQLDSRPTIIRRRRDRRRLHAAGDHPSDDATDHAERNDQCILLHGILREHSAERSANIGCYGINRTPIDPDPPRSSQNDARSHAARSSAPARSAPFRYRRRAQHLPGRCRSHPASPPNPQRFAASAASRDTAPAVAHRLPAPDHSAPGDSADRGFPPALPPETPRTLPANRAAPFPPAKRIGSCSRDMPRYSILLLGPSTSE